MRILCVGANHVSAALDLREKLAVDAAGLPEALSDLRARWCECEFALLSTCNRTEIYAARELHTHPREAELRAFLAERSGVRPGELATTLYTLADDEAVEHLFSVAAGLDSMVPGEAQIVAQVKEAIAAASECGAADRRLDALFQAALRTAKIVRSETGIAEGRTSVAGVAVERVARVFETLRGRCVLNIGAGKMNRLMLRRLAEMAPSTLLIANRSPQKAGELAREFGGQAADWRDLAEHLRSADVVVTGTGSATPILSAPDVRAAQQARDYRPLLIVDIAVPRDVAADAGQVENVFLANIDDLQQTAARTHRARRSERDAAGEIVRRQVEAWSERAQVSEVGPTIQALYRRLERIADEELASATDKLSTHADAEEDVEILRRTLHRTIRRICHPAVDALRRDAASPSIRAHTAALRRLFELDADEAEDPAADEDSQAR